MPSTYTPVRYPGGKTKIYPEVYSILDCNGLLGAHYSEVFAGGAGLAIKLLLKGDVSSITINDYDNAVYCMWDAIVNHSQELCDFVSDVPLDVETWLGYREIYRQREQSSGLKLGFAALYLNRTNVSGILGGGIIGGMEQKGNFKMDARFTRSTLIRKISAIGKRRDDIEVTCLDAECFIKDRLMGADTFGFAYFDPPYVQKGPGLYRDSYDEHSHRALAKAIGSCKCKWLVTYDADELIGELYQDFEQSDIGIRYSANVRTIGREKMILGPGLKWPDSALM